MSIKIGYCAPAKDIELVADLGFDYIELPLDAIGSMSDSEFTSLLTQLKEKNLPCPVCNKFLPPEYQVTGVNTNWDAALDYVKIALQRASMLGTKFVVFGSGGARNAPAGYSLEKAKMQFIEFCRLCGSIAQDFGVTIVLEPLNSMESNILNTVLEGIEYVTLINHPNVKLLADYFHMLVEKEQVGSVIAAGNNLMHTHTASLLGRKIPQRTDTKTQMIFTDALKLIGYCGHISIEGKANIDQRMEAAEALSLLNDLMA